MVKRIAQFSRTNQNTSLLSKLDFGFVLFCHPELVSGSPKVLISGVAEQSSTSWSNLVRSRTESGMTGPILKNLFGTRDGLVKSPIGPVFVIPAKAGIQLLRVSQ